MGMFIASYIYRL